MEKELIDSLINEIRDEYNIPPFIKNEKLEVLIKQSNQYLCDMVENIDYSKDLRARELLKNRVFYGHNNKINEFYNDYQFDILGWQFACMEKKNNEITNIQ